MPDLPEPLAKVLKLIGEQTKANIIVKVCFCRECEALWESVKTQPLTKEVQKLKRHWYVVATVSTTATLSRLIAVKFRPQLSPEWIYDAFKLIALIFIPYDDQSGEVWAINVAEHIQTSRRHPSQVISLMCKCLETCNISRERFVHKVLGKPKVKKPTTNQLEVPIGRVRPPR